MEGDFLKSYKTCKLIESLLKSRHPNCTFNIGYSIERNQWELGIGTSNGDTVFGNNFSLTGALEKAETQQDFINILIYNAGIQAEFIVKESQGNQP
jgi:hypothetical protein